MNGTNLLADTPVPRIADADFGEMYMLQMALQARLNTLPTPPINPGTAAPKIIYWGHCIRAELEELVEWLTKQDDPTWIKELRMEAIDVVHFVFNVGLELGVTPEFIVAAEEAYTHQKWQLDQHRIHAAILILNKTVVELVNQLPWKTWKTYGPDVDSKWLSKCYADLIRAMLILCNACALNREAIIDMYFAKNKVNHERQDNGY